MRAIDDINFCLKDAKAYLNYNSATEKLTANADAELIAFSKIGCLNVEWNQRFDARFKDSDDNVDHNNGIKIGREIRDYYVSLGDHTVNLIDTTKVNFHGIMLQGGFGNYTFSLGAGMANSEKNEHIDGSTDETFLEICGNIGSAAVRLQNVTGTDEKTLMQVRLQGNLPENINEAVLSFDSELNYFAVAVALDEIQNVPVTVEYVSTPELDDIIRVFAIVDQDCGAVLEFMNTNDKDGKNTQSASYGYHLEKITDYKLQ